MTRVALEIRPQRIDRCALTLDDLGEVSTGEQQRPGYLELAIADQGRGDKLRHAGSGILVGDPAVTYI